MNGFIIHQRKYKETSLFLELFTRCRGRLSVLAKGANRPKSNLGSDLQPLCLLDFTLHERSTIPILKSVDLIENYHINMGSKMLSIFYINELIYKGLLKEDSSPLIFDSYVKALREISNVDSCLETALRKFEYSFLYSSGVISDLIATNSGEPVLPEFKYKVVPGGGVFRDMECSTYSLSGDTLLQLRDGNRLDKTALRESKYLMRGLIEHFLDGKELATRNLFKSKGKNL